MQRAIPFLLMRGGTSRGPYFNARDLPEDRTTLDKVLISLLGSGHPLNIDGLGGGSSVTTKVAILSPSEHEWADIDYLFAQVGVEDGVVDYKPTCGNILSGVGAAAIEMGLIPPTGNQTVVKIRAVNTSARISATVQTPGGVVRYDGTASIDGVPGSAAPVELQFMDTVGGATGSLLPTGNPIDVINGSAVTCLDIAMPMVIGRGSDFGVSGTESPQALDNDRALAESMELIRIEAGKRMGLGDVSNSVIPKFGLLLPPRSGGSFGARYFTPWKCHPSMAVTGSQCLAGCTLLPGSVGEGLIASPPRPLEAILIEHPAGKLEVRVDYRLEGDTLILNSAGLIRTTRKLAEGNVFIPAHIWE